jgi:hypothetical protein
MRLAHAQTSPPPRRRGYRSPGVVGVCSGYVYISCTAYTRTPDIPQYRVSGHMEQGFFDIGRAVQKSGGYCWSFYFHVTPLLSLCQIFSTSEPAITAYARHHRRHFEDDQQYPGVLFAPMHKDNVNSARDERTLEGAGDPRGGMMVSRVGGLTAQAGRPPRLGASRARMARLQDCGRRRRLAHGLPRCQRSTPAGQR